MSGAHSSAELTRLYGAKVPGPSSAIPRIRCRKCRGSGQVELPAHLLDVLRQVTAGATAGMVAERLNIQPTAANNRLAALRGLGLLTASRSGKTLYWYPVAHA